MAKKSANKGKQPEESPATVSVASGACPRLKSCVHVASDPLIRLTPDAAHEAFAGSDGAEQREAAHPRREPVAKVNNANLSDLKNAADDVVKDFFSLPSHNFKRSYIHDDVRLSLGWASVAVAIATSYYGYKTEFHESKFWVSVGVALYVVLNTILALYVAYVEQNIIFEGKRRTFASRISTERLTISSLAASSPTTLTTSSWIPFPLSLLVPRPSPSASSSAQYPLYTLTLSYAHSANANKSLLHSSEVVLTRSFAEMFDQEGRIAVGEVERWLSGGLVEVVGEEKGR
ncbi:hypothetical protein JCM21900_002468 [Sporobolomyces salmonicolor]